MDTKSKVIGAGAAAAAAAAVGVGVAVARRRGTPTVFRVRPAEDGWTVEEEGAKGVAGGFGTKKEALSAARKLASAVPPSTLVLHYADGREQKRISYEAD